MFNYAIKELLKRNKIYLLNVMTLGLVTLMIITLTSLGTAYKEASKLPFQDVQGNIIVQRNGNVSANMTGVLLSCSLAPINQAVIPEISKINGVGNISKALSLWVFDTDYFKRVVGVDWNDNYGKKLTSEVVDGKIPSSDSEVLVEKTYGKKNGLEVGSKFMAMGNSFTVSGILQAAGNEIIEADIYLNLKVGQKLAYQSKNLQATETFNPTDVNLIFIDVAQTKITGVAQEINQTLSSVDASSGTTPLGQTIGTYNIYTPQSFEEQIASVFRLSDKLIWIISAVLLIGAALIIARNTLRIILERRKEFGIMKSVGFRGSDIQKEIGIETSLQVLAGFGIGLIASALAIIALAYTTVSIAIPWELTAYPHFLLANPNDANVVQTHFLPIKIEPWYVLITFGLVLAIGLGTSFFSIWRISKIKPMEVMKNE
jgi:ABC-type antimicrobial peptide transport system permease subunit